MYQCLAHFQSNYLCREMAGAITELHCSAEFTAGLHAELISLSVANTFVALSAILENALILAALHRESSLHPPSKLLYRNLAITDLGVGMVVVPLRMAYWISVVTKSWDICYYTDLICYAAGYVICVVSLSTLTVISVDRLLALKLGLRYKQVVTYKRMRTTVFAIWIMALVGVSPYFWNARVTSLWGDIILLLCLAISVVAYTKIFFTLRHLQIQVNPGQPAQATPLNIDRYKSAVSSALWVQVTLVLCYLPAGLAAATTPQTGITVSRYLAREILSCLIFLNSSLNPLLYCWKIREVRQAVKDTVKHLFSSSG